MKKNAMLKIAAILMVAVLLTTCAISSTFAKYVTSDQSSDAARVAKFGVTVATDVTGLFASNYDDLAADGKTPNGDDVVGLKSVEKDGKITIEADDVVAPGTSGSVSAATTITGKPEVAVNIATKATVTLTGWLVEGVYYCPLKVTVNGTSYYGNKYTSADKFADDIEAAITSANNVDLAPNTDLGAGKTYDVAISWAWAYDSTTDADAGIDDEKDTYLGDAAAGLIKDVAASTISITIEQTVTQIDNYETESASASASTPEGQG